MADDSLVIIRTSLGGYVIIIGSIELTALIRGEQGILEESLSFEQHRYRLL